MATPKVTRIQDEAVIRHVVGGRAIESLHSLKWVWGGRIGRIGLGAIVARCGSGLNTLVVVLSVAYDEFPSASELQGADLRQLRVVHLQGKGAGRWFSASIVPSCARTLKDIHVSRSLDLPGELEGEGGGFNVLQKLYLEGSGASRWFASIFRTSAKTLEEVCILEHAEQPMPTAVEGDCEALRKIRFEGDGTAKCVAKLVSDHCLDGAQIEEMRIVEQLASGFSKDEVQGDNLRSLMAADLNGRHAAAWFGCCLAPHCAATLRRLRLWDFQGEFDPCLIRLVPTRGGAAVGEFSALQSVDVHGAGACVWFAAFASCCFSRSGEPTPLEQLDLDDGETRFSGVLLAHCRLGSSLRKVRLTGKGAAAWFLPIAKASALTLEDLEILELHDTFPQEAPDNFTRLKRTNLIGDGASRWLASILAASSPSSSSTFSSSPSLEEIRMSDTAEAAFPPLDASIPPRALRNLSILDLDGDGAARWCSSMMTATAAEYSEGKPTPSLKTLNLCERAAAGFPAEFPVGDFRRITHLYLDGVGAGEWFAHLAERCARSLRVVEVNVVGDSVSKFPLCQKVDFPELTSAVLRDNGKQDSSGCFGSMSESCAATLEEPRSGRGGDGSRVGVSTGVSENVCDST
eukprot:GHVU01097405.1.p1 GENE.GHVU01097405.1~~GHVU01097405.1.p1  ORF type:complete len:654 (-),score=72.45 GHVU01097405.1:388-2280(-)